jgi:hypothetical protein
MAAEELPPALATLVDPDREERAERPPRRTVTPAQARVTVLVCLGLWAVLFAPALERSAHTAPPGVRRAAALAVIRPVAAISEALSVSDAAEGAMRALGRDPAAPGGELVLPQLEPPAFETHPSDAPDAPVIDTAVDVEPSRQPRSPEPTPRVGGRRSSPGVTADAEDTEMRVPTTRDRLRVVVVGDSLSQGLGPALSEAFDPGMARVISLGRISTGLARPDYFNWQAAMRRIVEEIRPDLVFVLLGTNDDQPIFLPSGETVDFGSVGWTQAYRERANVFLREATSAGTRVVWVGIPVVAERDRWDFYRRLNDVYADTAEPDPLATYVDTWRVLQARHGGYTAYLRNEHGQLQQMRAGDGFHFTPTGYGYLARLAIRSAAEAFGLHPTATTFRI